MQTKRRVRLFRHGRNQALPILREYELPGNVAIVRKVGERLIVEPVLAKSLLAVLGELQPMMDDFPVINELPIEPK